MRITYLNPVSLHKLFLVGHRACLLHFRRMLSVLLVLILSGAAQHVQAGVVYEGTEGPGLGKKIVFLAGDHEYRSEETLPALARILAKHHGFHCTVLFTTDPQTGHLLPGSSHIEGMEALEQADLLVIFLRFQNFPEEQMQYLENYLKRGGPVIGLRTSTHAFQIPDGTKFSKYSYGNASANYKGGFGRQILGETWAGHYGKNHTMSTRLDVVKEQKEHPILRGVTSIWVPSGAYWTEPQPDSLVLAMAQPLNGMTAESPVASEKSPCPGIWVRSYNTESGQKGRVFTTTYGASEDLLNEGFRRVLVNASYWATGMEEQIQPQAPIDFVGPYHPATFRFEGYRRQVLPSELAGWESPIMPWDRPVKKP